MVSWSLEYVILVPTDELLQYPRISSLKLVILLRQEQVVNLFGHLSPMTPLLPTHHPLHATSHLKSYQN